MEKMILKNSNSNSNFNKKNREMIINKFIEKFPKTNLQILIKLNQHYNKKNVEFDENSNNIIFNNFIKII
jgi:hypothetical protein